ncbi:hypothetical protein [Pseudomonas mosselii]|uniref:hypothetical protein n=1 Tax=Pseudomonas mosselii TaxID=78327 RepID=UPI0021DAB8DE|nr:hypothetical protein [Pseudomonas mosselii]MCU9529325.1 hypothetical protein [Pseudomonas mosselii]MCU9536616.1 hypothetical protein [Pseudomonas mosselii]MCU9542236.1 hypothetical protein [Pseudomonas mosselii]MCU9548341.1 hypothetical protein [Pseudomonas mosselii]
MADKATRSLKMSDEEFDLCVALNTHSGPQTSTEMLTAARRVLVEGMEPGEARAEFVSITKQAISNVLTRLRAQYNTRIAVLSPDQFDLCASVVCPEISSRAKTLARTYLVESSGEIPASSAASALEAGDAIAKLREFHLRVLSAYIVK